MDRKLPDQRLLQMAVCPEGTQKDRALKIAEMYGKRQQLEALLQDRYGHVDYSFLLKMALESTDGASSSQGIEKIIADIPPSVPVAHEPGPLRVVYEIAKDAARWGADISRHVLYGALPGAVQERIAKRRDEDAGDYTKANAVVGTAAGASLYVYECYQASAGHTDGFLLSIAGAVAALAGLIRLQMRKEGKTSGMATLAGPYYLSVEISPLVGKLLAPVKDLCTDAADGLQTMYTDKKRELSSLPPPSAKVRVDITPALPANTADEENVYATTGALSTEKKMTHG